MFLEEDEIGVGESELVVWGVVIESSEDTPFKIHQAHN